MPMLPSTTSFPFAYARSRHFSPAAQSVILSEVEGSRERSERFLHEPRRAGVAVA